MLVTRDFSTDDFTNTYKALDPNHRFCQNRSKLGAEEVSIAFYFSKTKQFKNAVQLLIRHTGKKLQPFKEFAQTKWNQADLFNSKLTKNDSKLNDKLTDKCPLKLLYNDYINESELTIYKTEKEDG